jgi:hypothetical protein
MQSVEEFLPSHSRPGWGRGWGYLTGSKAGGSRIQLAADMR